MSTALDGNAMAGDLLEVFGVELTAARCVCDACGTESFLAEAVVYMRGPGRVARCRACGEVLMVLVTIRGMTCVDMRGIASLSWRLRLGLRIPAQDCWSQAVRLCCVLRELVGTTVESLEARRPLRCACG